MSRENIAFRNQRAFGVRLNTGRVRYEFNAPQGKRVNPNGDGVCYHIEIPELLGEYKLSVENRMPPEFDHRTTGCLSWQNRFSKPRLDLKIWGLTGSLKTTLTPEDSGKTLFLLHKPTDAPNRVDNWVSWLVVYLRPA